MKKSTQHQFCSPEQELMAGALCICLSGCSRWDRPSTVGTFFFIFHTKTSHYKHKSFIL